MTKLLKSSGLLLGLSLALVSGIQADDAIYQTQFETGEFTVGPLQDKGLWRNLSNGDGALVEITTENAPADGGQALRLVRGSGQDNPFARLTFVPMGNAERNPFDVSFRMAADPKTDFFVAQVVVGDSSTGSAGALAGLLVRKGASGKNLHAYAINEAEILLVGDPAPARLEALTFYDFHLQIDPSTARFSMTVKENGQLLGELKDVAIKGQMERYNVVGIRIAGGGNQDTLYLDDLKIWRP